MPPEVAVAATEIAAPEVAVFELASLFDGGLTFGGVILGGLAIFILVIAFRMVREKKTLMEVLGAKNGYTKEKVFLAAVEDIKDLIREKAIDEGKRMDKHGNEIGELRDAVQNIDRRLARVEGSIGSKPDK